MTCLRITSNMKLRLSNHIFFSNFFSITVRIGIAHFQGPPTMNILEPCSFHLMLLKWTVIFLRLTLNLAAPKIIHIHFNQECLWRDASKTITSADPLGKKMSKTAVSHDSRAAGASLHYWYTLAGLTCQNMWSIKILVLIIQLRIQSPGVCASLKLRQQQYCWSDFKMKQSGERFDTDVSDIWYQLVSWNFINSRV